MPESAPYLPHIFDNDNTEAVAEEGPKKLDPIRASNLQEGDWSVGHSKRIKSVDTSAHNGNKVAIVFEPTEQEVKDKREGTTILLDPDDELEIERGKSNSF